MIFLVNYWYKMYLTFPSRALRRDNWRVEGGFYSWTGFSTSYKPSRGTLCLFLTFFKPSPGPLRFSAAFLDFFHSRNPQRWFFVSFRDKANVKYEWNFLICKYYLFYIFILLLTYSEHKRRTFGNCQVRFYPKS